MANITTQVQHEQEADRLKRIEEIKSKSNTSKEELFDIISKVKGNIGNLIIGDILQPKEKLPINMTYPDSIKKLIKEYGVSIESVNELAFLMGLTSIKNEESLEKAFKIFELELIKLFGKPQTLSEKISFSDETREQFSEKVYALGESLSAAVEKYQELFGREFGFIEAAEMNISYSSIEDLQALNSNILKLNLDNIEAGIIFDGFDGDEEDSIDFVHFIEKLKSLKDPKVQAHILLFIDTLSNNLINKNLKKLREDSAKGKGLTKKVKSQYKKALQKFFETIALNANIGCKLAVTLDKNGELINT